MRNPELEKSLDNAVSKIKECISADRAGYVLHVEIENEVRRDECAEAVNPTAYAQYKTYGIKSITISLKKKGAL